MMNDRIRHAAGVLRRFCEAERFGVAFGKADVAEVPFAAALAFFRETERFDPIPNLLPGSLKAQRIHIRNRMWQYPAGHERSVPAQPEASFRCGTRR